MKRRALITWGGWDGHEPEKVAGVFRTTLEKEGFEVEVSPVLDSYADADKLKALHLIVPIWTMGKIDDKLCNNVVEAVAGGAGIAGCHGGMCDSFRENVNWQFMTGGNWVSHPGGDGVEYTVAMRNSTSLITEGLKDFKVRSEQYYLHVDPAVEVLATTRFPSPGAAWYHSSNREVDMPVAWTKRWGHGRVFYSSLGHHADIFDIPGALELMRRGFLWAAEGKDVAIRDRLSADAFKSDKKMF